MTTGKILFYSVYCIVYDSTVFTQRYAHAYAHIDIPKMHITNFKHIEYVIYKKLVCVYICNGDQLGRLFYSN